MADARWKMANDKSASKFASSFLSPFLLILARRRNSFISMQVQILKRPKGRKDETNRRLKNFSSSSFSWFCCAAAAHAAAAKLLITYMTCTQKPTHTHAHTHICEHVEGPREQCTARNLCVHRYPSWLGNSRYSFPFLWPQVCPLHLYQNCF